MNELYPFYPLRLKEVKRPTESPTAQEGLELRSSDFFPLQIGSDIVFYVIFVVFSLGKCL